MRGEGDGPWTPIRSPFCARREGARLPLPGQNHLRKGLVGLFGCLGHPVPLDCGQQRIQPLAGERQEGGGLGCKGMRE